MIKQCKNCEKDFEDISPNKLKLYCSEHCKYIFKKRNLSEKTAVNKKCSNCNKEFEDNTRNYNKIYCSKECYRIVTQANFMKTHPNYKDPQIGTEARKEYNKIQQKKFRKENPDKCKDYHLRDQYGITLEDKKKMYNDQNGLCYICNITMEFNGTNCCVDHDHVTGIVRHLLCRACNSILGYSKENIIILKKAIEYLKEFCEKEDLEPDKNILKEEFLYVDYQI